MLLMNLDNFFSHSGPITWTSIGRRLYDVRIKTLLSITNDLHSGYMPDVIVPYTVPEWRRFYSQIWSNENVYHEIVALISADQNQLAYQLWEWLKANYPNYVKID